jgi:hypothetical protein
MQREARSHVPEAHLAAALAREKHEVRELPEMGIEIVSELVRIPG